MRVYLKWEVRKIGTKERLIEIAREILRSYGFPDKIIREITENEEMFLKLFRAFHSKSGSKKKHMDSSSLIKKIAKPHKQKEAKEFKKLLLAKGILKRNSGTSVGFSEIGSEISIALLSNQTFAFQKSETSSSKKTNLKMGVKNI